MQTPPLLDAGAPGPLLNAYDRAATRLLLLDYDGTLKPFVDRPEDALPDPELRDLLRRLAGQPGTTAAIVTGRTRTNMEKWLGAEGLGLSTEHGLWIRWPGDGDWTGMFPPGFQPEQLQAVRDVLEEYQRATPGSRIEIKDASFAWHYRLADPALIPERPRELLERLRTLIAAENLPCDCLDGKMVIEVRLHGVHKGNIVEFLTGRGLGFDFQLAIGDDATDENLFAALPDEAFTIKVGAGETGARLRLPGVEQARELLERLAESGRRGTAGAK